MNRSKNGPIFIVGAPRSGTTLLQYMLRSHPRISLPTGESHFMIPLYRNAAKFGDLRQIENVHRVLQEMYRISANFLDTDLHGMRFSIEILSRELQAQGCDTIPKIIAGLFEENARGEGKVRWGDKTPWYLLHMPLILEMYSNAQFIHIIRDGRDVALSLFNRQDDFGIYNIYRAAEYWVTYLECGQKLGAQLEPSVYHEVRYEDLLEKPKETVRQICDFIEEEYSDKVVHFRTSTEPGKTPLLQKPIQKTNAYKWKRQLRYRQIEVFESVAGTVLKKNGYELETSERERKSSLLEKAFYRGHNALCNLIYRKKWVGIH